MIVPSYPRWLSLATLGYGIAAFIWLTPEDTLWVAVVLGLLGALLAALHLVYRKFGGRRLSERMRFLGMIALGAGIGGGTACVTAGLLFLKSAIHAHLFPDYPLTYLLAVLARAPTWALAGGLIGLAAAILLQGNHPNGASS
jgi:hypothetical protein